MFDPHLATNSYYDRHFDIQSIKVLPGEYYATGDNLMICTVLGSCVSVCLRDRQSGIGGLNHFMLPHDSSQDANSVVAASGRYGLYAMELLINQLLKMGANRNRFEAKVFGGGQVLKNMTFMNVGQRNVSFVLEHLKNESIPIVGQDVLDIYPRKVCFFPKTGKVMLKKIHSLHNNTIIEREKAYLHEIDNQPVAGEIDLF